jgi:hypothetical protein
MIKLEELSTITVGYKKVYIIKQHKQIINKMQGNNEQLSEKERWMDYFHILYKVCYKSIKYK